MVMQESVQKIRQRMETVWKHRRKHFGQREPVKSMRMRSQETKTERPEFEKLLHILKEGDTLAVTKLDRFARSMAQGSELVSSLITEELRFIS